MNDAYLVLGGNLGDKLKNICQAEALIEAQAGRITRRSAVFRTAAWGNTGQPDFYNRALLVETRLEPEELLQGLLGIEAQMGRIRKEKWGARTMDIDIILYNDAVIDVPGLHIPHPHMQERNFVLAPLAEIAAELLHPVLQKTVRQLLRECPDASETERLTLSNP